MLGRTVHEVMLTLSWILRNLSGKSDIKGNKLNTKGSLNYII